MLLRLQQQGMLSLFENDIDMLWIGARTTVNPFYVQEIANALKGVNIPVFIKNPIHPEIGLWIGAFERIYNSGLTQLVAIHRGFITILIRHLEMTPNGRCP